MAIAGIEIVPEAATGDAEGPRFWATAIVGLIDGCDWRGASATTDVVAAQVSAKASAGNVFFI
jgi:hypothetical protein